MCGSPTFIHIRKLNAGGWHPIIGWQGLTLRTLSVKVTVQSSSPKHGVEWRRWGAAIIPYSSGTISGSTQYFKIYPGDLSLRVDVKADEPDTEVLVEVE